MKTVVRIVDIDGEEALGLEPFVEHSTRMVSCSVWYNNDPEDPSEGEIRITVMLVRKCPHCGHEFDPTDDSSCRPDLKHPGYWICFCYPPGHSLTQP